MRLLSPLTFVSPAKGMSGPECGWAILRSFSGITGKQTELGDTSELLQTPVHWTGSLLSAARQGGTIQGLSVSGRS